MAAPTLELQLESQLPGSVAVGDGTALFIHGWCFCPQADIRSLSFLVDGERQAVAAHGMPRLDPFRMLHPDQQRSYRSGFWGLARLAPGPAERPVSLALSAELADGSVVTAALAQIAREQPETPLALPWPAASGPRVAIAMATYNPPEDLFAAQIASIRGQTHENWLCIISDDHSAPERYSFIEATVAADPRFIVSRSPRRLGFYRNFERALTLTPRDADFFALADQDDRWYPEKLSRLLVGIGPGMLAYSDARVVSRAGHLLSDTWWTRRRNNHTDLLSLLVANAVTGAASLLRPDVLAHALPFPPPQFAHFHDHWLGLVALSLGEIAYVDAPLYDYVQHHGASLGHAGANRMTSLTERVRHPRPLHDSVRMWRLHYFVDIWRLRQFCAVLLARCGPELTPAKRRTLERFLEGDASAGFLLELGARGARELVATPETLGAEWALFHALGWRALLGLTARPRPQRRGRLDALPPPSLIQAPGRIELDPDVAAIAAKIEPLRWAVDDDAPPRVNLLIPTIDLDHFFGGYIGKFNLAHRLRARGMNVRIVTVDPVGPLPSDWQRRIEGFAGLSGLLEQTEVVFGREAGAVPISPRDTFIATTWWTAHIAGEALAHVAATRFVYLIQEYEPFTFAMGTFAALAAQSYTLPHVALFSTELLRGYFRAHGLGVYRDGDAEGDRASAAFENAITRVGEIDPAALRSRSPHRLLFYARPEAHAARNMFELGVLALARALRDGSFTGDWEFNGIGSIRDRTRIGLGDGITLRLHPRSDQASYAALLREHDVGLALMYTPHPSLVPIEMASAGMLTVTNSFENKTPAALEAISSNLVVADPTIEALAGALRVAAERVSDDAGRVAGSRVRWSTDWERSFTDATLEILLEVLGADAAVA